MELYLLLQHTIATTSATPNQWLHECSCLEKPDVTGIRRTAKFTDFSIYIIVVLIIV